MLTFQTHFELAWRWTFSRGVGSSVPIARNTVTQKRSGLKFASVHRGNKRMHVLFGTEAVDISSVEQSFSTVPSDQVGDKALIDEATKTVSESSMTTETFGDINKMVSKESELDQLLSNVTDNLTNMINSSKQATAATAGKVSDAFNVVASIISSTFNGISAKTQNILQLSAEEFTNQVNNANNAFTSSTAATEQYLGQLVDQVDNSIPPELKEYLETAKGVASSTGDFVLQYKVPLTIVTVTTLVYGGYVFWTYRFLGYSGDMLPEKALQLLQADVPSLLIDLRSEDKQQNDGIPKLRRQALGKAVPVPLCNSANNPLSTPVSFSPKLSAGVTAAYIAGLKQVTVATNFVIMSDNDGDSRAVARALIQEKAGNAFVLLGGYKAWVDSGLPVEVSKEYDITPVDYISDKALDIVEPLKTPSSLLLTSLGVGAAGLTVWNYRYVLRLIGVLGPSLAFLAYLIKRYDSPQEFWDDLVSLLANFVAEGGSPQQTNRTVPSEATEKSVLQAVSENNDANFVES